MFYDLIFVAAVATLGHGLSSHTSHFGLFCLVYWPIWSTWSEVNAYINRYDTLDVTHKFLFLFQMVGVLGMAASSSSVLEENSINGSLSFAMSFIFSRLSLIIMYSFAAIYNQGRVFSLVRKKRGL